ncbi:hypothetical protein [Candidatus Halobonum tyrrellensis]|uniref:Uncharacterized protein n=1 Tax=Candidatus Halobonum tyrrellensis G22 TaxID=1324957 RepID=V4HP34_9EURY|nr:hypothetical protein [Candidatus Halobonum tyrrellensis]ESP89679.1 hypothetical protein K933_02776 [Candidatus Halobonum tyrrellensis G22]
MASSWSSEGTRAPFVDFGVDDDEALIDGANRRLGVPPETAVRVTPTLLRAVADAFHDAFREETPAGEVPPAVDAALDDAVAWSGREFDRVGGATVHVRNVLLPLFYDEFAGFTRAYTGESSAPEFDRDDE